MLKISYILITFISLFQYAFGSSSTSGGIVLKEGIGARPLGMAEAYTGVADDATGILWNPAGIADIVKNEISATYFSSIAETSQSFISFACPIIEWNSAFSLSLKILDGGILEKRFPGWEEGRFEKISAEQDYLIIGT